MLIKIEKLVYGGSGLGRADGRVVLVPFVLPGEEVEIETVRETRGLVHARAMEWQQRSPSRVPPECPVFGQCGGCHYQHIPYADQLDYKRQILIETLARVGKIKWSGEVKIVSSEPWGYRNRTQLRVAKKDRQNAAVGFMAPASHRLVAAGACPINAPLLDQAHEALLRMSEDRRFPKSLREIEFFTNDTDLQVNILESDPPSVKRFFSWCEEVIPGFSTGDSIDYRVGEDVFRVTNRSFFQVNRFLIEDLVREAVGGASGAVALDLFAGVGLFTLPLARAFERVVAVDTSRGASGDLRHNLERAGARARVVNLNVANYLMEAGQAPDFVIADPPRSGLGAAVTRELVRLQAARLALVSCDPATLARDLAPLLAGGYQIDSLTLIDLFPQTFHIETVVRLSCRQAGPA